MWGGGGVVYTVTYGLPQVDDPHENKKLVVGVVAMALMAYGLFRFLRSFGIQYATVN
jgi:hypothetical protein